MKTESYIRQHKTVALSMKWLRKCKTKVARQCKIKRWRKMQMNYGQRSKEPSPLVVEPTKQQEHIVTEQTGVSFDYGKAQTKKSQTTTKHHRTTKQTNHTQHLKEQTMRTATQITHLGYILVTETMSGPAGSHWSMPRPVLVFRSPAQQQLLNANNQQWQSD